MDFSVLYYYEKACGLKHFVVLMYKGRIYERPCTLDSNSRPVFRFLGKLWRPDVTLTLFPDTL